MAMTSWSPRRSICAAFRVPVVSAPWYPGNVDRGNHRASRAAPRSPICSDDDRTRSWAVDACGNRGQRVAACRLCRRAFVATVSRPNVDAAAVPLAGLLLGKMGARRAGCASPCTAAASTPASDTPCTVGTPAGSTSGSSIPATWSQADPWSQGGS